MKPNRDARRSDQGTDLLRSEVITDSFLKTFPDAFFGDGLQIALGQNRINDRDIGRASIWGD